MNHLPFKEIIRNIKKGVLSPVYFLYGEEPYYIQKIIQAVEYFVKETNNENNFFVSDGKKQSVNDTLLILQEVGMFSSFKLVLVRDAHQLKEFQTSNKDESITPLFKFIQTPIPDHHLILIFENPEKKLDERKSHIKTLLEHPNVIACKSEKVKEYKIKDWIKQYVLDIGRMIDDRAAFKLAENIGNDLMRIEKEIDKIILNTSQKEEISETHVNQYTFINREYNLFELQKALAQRDILKANLIIKYFGENKKDFPMELILPSLHSYFLKLLKYHLLDNKEDNFVKEQLNLYNVFFVKEYKIAATCYSRTKVKQILYLIKEYDLKSKKIDNYSLENIQLLQELAWKVMH